MDISIKNRPGICYVDDNAERRAAVYLMLADHASVMTFPDPNATLSLIRDKVGFAVVICNLETPGRDALKFLRQVDAIDPAAVGIVVTALPNDHDQVAAARLDAYCWRVLTQDAFSKLSDMVRNIRDASAENARQRLRILRARHAPEIQKRLSALGVKTYDLSMLRRLESLIACHLAELLDISDLDKFLLAFAADHYDIGQSVSEDPAGEREAAVQILGGLEGFEKVLEAARDWRERFDGSGPQGKGGSEIPLFARVIAVVSTFASFIAGNKDVRPMRLDDALGLIRDDSGKLFDPQVVQVFCQMISEVREKKASGGRGDADTANLFLGPPLGFTGMN